MKYLKKYEEINNSLIYKKGDYVVLNVDKINTNNKFYDDPIMTDENKFGVIYYCQDFDNSFPYPYSIKTYVSGEDSDGTNIRDDEIERLMTPDEIDIFKMKEDANKFNI